MPSSNTKVTERLPGSSGGAMMVEKEEVVYSRYLTVFNRSVRFPDPATGKPGAVHEFDIAGHPRADFQFSVVFPFHPAPPAASVPAASTLNGNGGGRRGGEVTVLREYCQGLNQFLYCLPTGGFDPKKHKNLEDCAIAELSEEAGLCGGSFIRLLPDGHPGIPEVKWSLNRFTPFLVLAPEKDHDPGEQDAEELIEVMRIDVSRLKELMFSGDMQTPSIVTCSAALEHLEKMGLI
eukprot:CAMPEP_0196584240 /NCGR_PEP_ID=MMETSP1081-20130531/46346_1 /TAXON_ID=36882 /ORGANISM="Pyramimonas amylifera, Strain CCMP720" /LENGTH=234 /DNA_ID=CAMNT_0041905379 /DNA_START=280 /DNA_END=984 /DNA_ORIENTATION=-